MRKNSIWNCLASILIVTVCGAIGHANTTSLAADGPGIQEKKQALEEPKLETKRVKEKQKEKQSKTKLEKEKQRVRKLADEATQAFGEGNYESALRAATELCELRPDVMRFQFLRGNIGFAAGKMTQSISAFDQVIRLDADLEPQLWQRGLALYYAQRFADGVKQFETHQTVNSQDVENAVWHLLCAARVSDVDKARKKLIPITDDTRVPMSQVYEMFAGRMTPQEVLKAAQATNSRVSKDGGAHRLQRYYAHLYIGLYHEMLGKSDSAKASLKSAADINPLGKQNFMGQVARVHLQLLKTKSVRQQRTEKKAP